MRRAIVPRERQLILWIARKSVRSHKNGEAKFKRCCKMCSTVVLCICFLLLPGEDIKGKEQNLIFDLGPQQYYESSYIFM